MALLEWIADLSVVLCNAVQIVLTHKFASVVYDTTMVYQTCVG